MNVILKSSIDACVLLITATASLTVQADTSVFSNKGTIGTIEGTNGNLSLNIVAAENTKLSEKTRNNSSSQTNLSGAFFYGSYYTGTECWYGYGFTDNIQFQATGNLSGKLTASETIPVTWYEYCSISNSAVADKITFSEDLAALKAKASPAWDDTHYEYGNVQVVDHFDYSLVPASTGTSSLSSQNMEAVSLNHWEIGHSNSHDVQITQ